MNYKEALRYLDSFVDYEKIGYKSRRLFNLKRMRHLAQVFGNPQDNYPSIHIAGTKGKGSTAFFISGILKEANLKVGLYTSPHLTDPRERIRVNNEMISEDDFAYHAAEIKKMPINGKLAFRPTYFEIFTILTFNYFKAQKIDFGVIEVGLGGRLDATNIIKPVVSVMTPVSYDHTNILGNSLEKIAGEKAGIIKKGCIVVSASQEENALKAIQKKCKSAGAKLTLVGKDIVFQEKQCNPEKETFNIRGMQGKYENCTIHLLGRHQILNATTAVGVAECLIKKGVKISKENIKNGLEKTQNPGRCEIISRKPYIILDGAQNRASAKALADTVKRNFEFEHLILVLGISKGKDVKGIAEELAPLADNAILTKANTERAEDPHLIKKFITGKNVTLADSVKEALEKAKNEASGKDLILVTGSFFVTGEIKEAIFAQEKILA
ncbi:MAG: bifunctional folylpolyglutamate synthase/dihydrofolate synthase [Candidatus Omnitrophica bacterium]|nr:bifunctional folylpolyglutamate synthase/dihydrofolate synthase [Candidatus Omnitrophota bacterium]